MSKRRRVVAVRSNRPIDKSLIYYAQTFTNSQNQDDILAPSAACTATGLRWSLSITPTASNGSCIWAIVLLKEGETADTLEVSTTGSKLYTPEQNVLAFGAYRWDRDWETNSSGVQ